VTSHAKMCEKQQSLPCLFISYIRERAQTNITGIVRHSLSALMHSLATLKAPDAAYQEAAPDPWQLVATLWEPQIVYLHPSQRP